jgi:4-amino-4-deoxy-L-arabinose transferase-like glycosyltransferase
LKSRQAFATLGWVFLAVLIALGYLFQLGGDHIPRNGDELVYAHIARLTAESGHWLPLVSSYDFMRNTKPPLLFWQAMVAGGWGEHWSLFNLRLPSVVYLWATALMVGLLVRKVVTSNAGQDKYQSTVTAAIAAIVFLSFFSTYRYGRPYLTSGPETFWLFGVFFAIAWSPAKLLASRWMFPLMAGLAIGIACLYKSFAMVAPVGLGLALCYQMVGARKAPWQIFRPGVVLDGFKIFTVCALALGVFGLWFALDPLPGEVWREFVVGENAGKFKSSPGYLKVAFSGNGGVLVILTGYFVNAGLLLPLDVGAFWTAWRSTRGKSAGQSAISDAEKVMWLWLLALALVFMLPNQRSARYLIPAMPAVAVIVALYWQRMARAWFVITLVFCILGALGMGLIAAGAVRAMQDLGVYSPLFWLLLGLAVLASVVGIFNQKMTRAAAAASAFAVLFLLAWTTAPLNGDKGHFKPSTVALLQGQTVQVPNNFNGQFERYHFILPGAKVVAYDAPQPVDYKDVDALLKTSRYALVARRIGQAPCTNCRIIDSRWDLRSRQDASEGTWAALKTPDTFWYAKEYLVERSADTAN